MKLLHSRVIDNSVIYVSTFIDSHILLTTRLCFSTNKKLASLFFATFYNCHIYLLYCTRRIHRSLDVHFLHRTLCVISSFKMFLRSLRVLIIKKKTSIFALASFLLISQTSGGNCKSEKRKNHEFKYAEFSIRTFVLMTFLRLVVLLQIQFWNNIYSNKKSIVMARNR